MFLRPFVCLINTHSTLWTFLLLCPALAQLLCLGPITSLLQQETDLQTLLGHILAGVPYHILEQRSLGFACKCSPDKVRALIAGLTPQDISAALQSRGHLEIIFNLCNEVYRFDAEQVAAIRSDF
ncbi:MAG: Hsp33 family molecular chaperone HslO [Syntrophothermus sp.]|uniref:Hsp33 family molecular chaperone HslO n=1 Tax=Syntrophothermus sp. TaxID=2736299 RepID=UPI00257D182F|nr:Hsp33 family molecular chaperone HslO [Syntrophothermus sp.]NSW83003.1 Hsp33 family molecular chaperone HslO [Syntrophothermus sp.]